MKSFYVGILELFSALLDSSVIVVTIGGTVHDDKIVRNAKARGIVDGLFFR